MAEKINLFLPIAVVSSHILLVILALAILSSHSWGKKVTHFLGKNSLVLGLIVGLAAISGSLFYSEVIGYEPCVLCWWQRVFLYPIVFIFATALWRKNRSPYLYATPLAIMSGIIAAYHSYVYLGGESLLSCTSLGGACSKMYVFAYGYVTIPMMSLTISLYILLLLWAHKVYAKNSNAR